MKMAQIIVIAVILILTVLPGGWAAEPWPAEAWTPAEILTRLDRDFKRNMSGACYNPVTGVFWVCCNGGPSAFWALESDRNGDWRIATKGGKQAKCNLGRGDLEGICHVDYGMNLVYLMFEGADKIREYDTSDYSSASGNSEHSAALLRLFSDPDWGGPSALAVVLNHPVPLLRSVCV